MPVTVRSKILMRELWSQNLSWDENVMEKHMNLWSQLAHDLTSLNVTFPRYVVNEAFDTDLYLFCDSSKQSYGFALYNVQYNKSNLMFAKAKVTPIKPRSLPTLQLLSVFFGCKMPAFNTGFLPQCYIQEACDCSRCPSSFVLADVPANKNQFAKNRLKDISMMTQELKVKYNLNIVFKYVPTNQNPADLLTTGLSLNKFKDLLQFWTYGPEWLKTADSDWPVNELNCLSDANKKTIQTNVAIDNDQFQGPTKSFSNYGMLLRVTELVFRFIKIKCKVNIDTVQSAITYLVKTMQAKCFPKEITFLNSPGNRNIPDLVKDLNVYIDEEGVIRSRGRINKNVTHEEGVQAECTIRG